MNNNYEKKQFEEQETTNLILWVNTGFTILTGITTLILTILQFYK